MSARTRPHPPVRLRRLDTLRHRRPLPQVGFNAFAWSRAFGSESTKLWDWSAHPDVMAHTWKAAIDAQKK